MRLDALTLNYLRSLFTAGDKPQASLRIARSKAGTMARPLTGKIRVPVIDGFDGIEDLSEEEAKALCRAVYRENVFALTVAVIGTGAMPWTLEGPNPFNGKQMDRDTVINELPANVQAHLKGLLAECPHRVAEYARRKAANNKSHGQSMTTCDWFQRTLAAFFNKHLRQEVTVNHLVYPCDVREVTIEEKEFQNEN
jgi:hypothetical protein